MMEDKWTIIAERFETNWAAYNKQLNDGCETSDGYTFNDRVSLILLIEDNNQLFICNRNSEEYNKLFEDKYFEWFGIDETMSINDDNMKILEVVPVDNYKLKDQKLLNQIKAKWISDIEESISDDEALCNIAFANWKKSKRIAIRKKFENIIGQIENCDFDEIYEVIKNIWFDKKWKAIAKKLNYEIYEKWFDKSTDEQKKKLAIIMSFGWYFIIYGDEKKLPFTKKELHNYGKLLDYLVFNAFGDVMTKKKIYLLSHKIYMNTINKKINKTYDKQ